jgi:hypothetical protein
MIRSKGDLKQGISDAKVSVRPAPVMVLLDGRKIIQFLKEDYQRQDKAISQIASYINEQSEKVQHEYIHSKVY